MSILGNKSNICLISVLENVNLNMIKDFSKKINREICVSKRFRRTLLTRFGNNINHREYEREGVRSIYINQEKVKYLRTLDIKIKTLKSINSLRNISILRILTRITKIPAYIGGTVAVGGSYIAYKVEQVTNYTQDRFFAIKDLTGSFIDKSGDFFKNIGGDLFKNSEHFKGSETGNEDVTAVFGGTAAAVGIAFDDESKDENDNINKEGYGEKYNDRNNDMFNLTTQMIEIKNILASINQDTIKLPSIVVIGSQSSGKSSVLESIVGQNFLPKGSDMVTRRPIELTLVNESGVENQLFDFPLNNIYNISDFEQVKKILYDLNTSVSEAECISEDPIKVTIKSSTIPNLSLVDLPGYIQLESTNQPPELKKKIRKLCEKYLEAPNIILAISAANVDLANSTALHAARIADPNGERTIGVITKIDLVDPAIVKSILNNDKYPLGMGYVGVITKNLITELSGSIFSKKKSKTSNVPSNDTYESKYFQQHMKEFIDLNLGVNHLKKKLTKTLEQFLSIALKPTFRAIQEEFEEASYQFKVKFNDQSLTPHSYIANNVDLIKMGVNELSHFFSCSELKFLLKHELDQKILDLLAEKYWNKPYSYIDKINLEVDIDLSDMSITKIDDSYWRKKLDLTVGLLTKSGIGRLSTNLVINALMKEIENIVNITQLERCESAKNVVKDAAASILRSRYYSTVEQVENCIKPYKYEIEIENKEWDFSRLNTCELLKNEFDQCNQSYNRLKKLVGGRKLKQVMTYLDLIKDENKILNVKENLGFSSGLIQKGKEALFLKKRLNILKLRYKTILNSRLCKNKENKYYCPEIFLNAVASKIASNAVLFLNVELLNDFYYNFPRELDKNFFKNLSKEKIDAFAKEDLKIKSHIELKEKKDVLEKALIKMKKIINLYENNSDIGEMNNYVHSKYQDY